MHRKTVNEFDNINESWSVRNETLAIGKHYFYAIDVESENFCTQTDSPNWNNESQKKMLYFPFLIDVILVKKE